MNIAENPRQIRSLRAGRARLRPEHCIFGSSRGTAMARLGFRSFVSLAIGLLGLTPAPRAEMPQNAIGGAATAGVAVDASSVLKRVIATDPTGGLAQQRIKEALAKLDRDVARR